MVPPIQYQEDIIRVATDSAMRATAPQKAANETLTIISQLQVTLDIKELLAIFFDQVCHYVGIDAIEYNDTTRAIHYRNSELARHQSNYALKLLETELGSITFSRKRRFREAELATVEHLIGTLLYPLRNTLSYFDALKASHHDPLTKALNRSSLELNLSHEILLAERGGDQLGLMVIDLDHFKQINDQHGHLVGDHILCHVTDVMNQSLRGSDLLYRYGGDEFVIMLRYTGSCDAACIAERIRHNLSTSPCHHTVDGVTESFSITASIGYATFVKGDSAKSLFHKADLGVYRAKEQGRNCCASQ